VWVDGVDRMDSVDTGDTPIASILSSHTFLVTLSIDIRNRSVTISVTTWLPLNPSERTQFSAP
jgi:hypothetical protein